MSKITGNATVYYGPNPSTYNPNGSVLKSGDIVTALWKENNYVHIEYNSGSKKKRGFVDAGMITVQESLAGITNARAVRYVGVAGSTYDGPGTNYTENKPLPKGKKVWFVGQKPNGYACIEYSIGANDDKNKIRVYMLASKLSDSFTIVNYKTFNSNSPNTIPNGLPFAGAKVSQGFNDENTKHKGHLGYDMTGFSVIQPVFDGTVYSVTRSNTGANGRVVCVQHTVNGHTCYSAYCHLASIPTDIKAGVEVTTKTQIGVMGGSGNGSDSSYSTHLHLAIFTNKASTSPYGYCISGGNKRFEEIALNNANPYYYGSDENAFPRCGGAKFYDPYGVITSNGAVFDKL